KGYYSDRRGERKSKTANSPNPCTFALFITTVEKQQTNFMAKGSSFDKFIHREEKGAKKKEKIRQEKKQAREKNKEYFNQLKASKRKPADAGVSQPENKPGNKILKKNIKGKKDSPQAPAGIPAKSKENYEFPLNKYLAHAGICSRRDAVELIKKAQVTVNGAVVTEPGFKVSSKDLVTFNGKKITP